MQPGDRAVTSSFGLQIVRHCFEFAKSGGPPEQITTLDESLAQNSHRGPVFLPDGLTFLFTSRCGQRDNNALYVGSLDSRTVRRLMPVQSIVRYIQSSSGEPGTILYYRDGGLVARRFNPDTQELSGDPVPVVDKVDYSAAGLGLSFDASGDGRVAVLSRFGAGQTRLTWFDRSGEITGTLGRAWRLFATSHFSRWRPRRLHAPRFPDRQSRHLVRGSRPGSLLPFDHSRGQRLVSGVVPGWTTVTIRLGSGRRYRQCVRSSRRLSTPPARSRRLRFRPRPTRMTGPEMESGLPTVVADVMVASATDPAKRVQFLATRLLRGSSADFHRMENGWPTFRTRLAVLKCTFARLQEDQQPRKGKSRFRIVAAIFRCGARTARSCTTCPATSRSTP